MDLKKEIKLSDLVPRRRKKDAVEAEQPKPERKPRFGRKPKAEKPAKERKPAKAAKPRSSGARVPGRRKKLVGLKIGASQIAAAQVVNNGGPQVVQVARDSLEPGVVVGGELRDPDTLAASLRHFFKKNRLPRQNVRLGISNNRIGVRMFEIGGIDEPKQLANAIRYRAQEVLPIPLEEAVLDYHILGESADGEGHVKHRVLLVVAYRDLIDRYMAACKKAGLRLVGIDLEAFAILRALAPAGVPDEQAAPAALVVVSVGHDRTTFAVSDGTTCQFTRVLEWGGASLNAGIARALDLAPSEAEPIKLALSLSEPSIPAGLTSEQAEAVREAVQRELHTFARDLVSSLQFYQSQSGSLGIGEIVLTGGTAQLPGFAAELAKLIGVRVRVGDPLANVKIAKKVDREQPLGSLAAAIGLGIETS
ncbi:MAG TPA: type IV pilus assembly protein PilM [Gaiellaceae bacterium]|nr:type IV pilus assembly protein PilM [Gaiellaceae bacterium]